MRILSVTYSPKRSGGQLLCQVHKVPREDITGYSPTLSLPGPYSFVARFFNEAGDGICDKCVAEGLRAGTIDVANAEEFKASGAVICEGRDVTSLVAPVEPESIIEARAILAKDRWGYQALDVLEVAIEAARRNGRLGELAERLISAAMDHAAS